MKFTLSWIFVYIFFLPVCFEIPSCMIYWKFKWQTLSDRINVVCTYMNFDVCVNMLKWMDCCRFIPSSSFHFFATSWSSLLVSPLLLVPVSVLNFFFKFHHLFSPADHNFIIFAVVLLTVVCGVVMLQLFFFLHYSLGSF